MKISDPVAIIAFIVLGYIAVTFALGFIKTIVDGQEGFDAFDRAGFTLSAFVNGRVPKSAATSSLNVGESAEISIVDGIVEAETTRTISKTQS